MRPPILPTVRRRPPVVVSILAAAVVAVGGLGVSGAAAISAGHHPKLPPPLATPKESASIEGFAPDQSQFFCRSTVEPGVKAFERRVLAHYRVSHSDGDMRGCNVGGTSEHKDGRAWDWGVDYRIPAQRRAGKSMLRWLFTTDSHGNQDAMFRRLGLMYIIWNKRIWGGWSQRWEPYSCSGPTLCHVNHMHFSFGWAGAEQKTSYWTRKVSPVVEPPLPVLKRMHAHRSLRVTAGSGSRTAMWLVGANKTYRVTASGVWRHGKNNRVQSDAVCSKTSRGWAPSAAGSTGLGGDQLNAWGLQWTAVHNTGNGCNAKTHTYRLVLHQPTKSTVEVQIPGAGQVKESGAVKVQFTRTG